MTRLEIEIESEEQMIRLGEKFADLVGPGAVLGLIGELGAGKTRFVKGLARGLGIDPDDVTSPTFIIIAEHRGRFPLYHMDFYRLETAEEAAGIGIDEYFDASGVCAVEWADRLSEVLPPETIRIEIKITGPERRTVMIEGDMDLRKLTGETLFSSSLGRE